MWGEIFLYRLNFTVWRVRMVLQLVAVYFLWLAIFPKNGQLFGYTEPMILTYVLGSNLVQSITMASRSRAIGDEINNGDLSNYLIRPMNYFMSWFAKDIADKMMNILFTVIELILLYILLKPQIFIQTNIEFLFLCVIALIGAIIISFLLNLLLAFLGFWTPEVWAPQFIFFVISGFIAGLGYPLDIFPQNIYNFFMLTPFPYMAYFPLKIYFGNVDSYSLWMGFSILCFWIVALYILVNTIWHKGLKNYTSQGR